MMQKEIEITYIIKDLEELEKRLLNLGAVLFSKRILHRDIYQNRGDYFLRVSKETTDGKTCLYLTLKSEGNPNSIGEVKEKIEIEEEFDKKQIKTILEMITLIGFKRSNSYKKIRKIYKLLDCECCIDTMENQTYLEIEFSNRNNLDKIVSHIQDCIKQ